MNLSTLLSQRYTTKAFDPSRKIPHATLEELLGLLRQSPSSVNSQPWHFVVASTDEGKARLAVSTQDTFAYNQPKVLNASHVIVLCTRTDMTEEHLGAILEQEDIAGRFRSEEAKATGQKPSSLRESASLRPEGFAALDGKTNLPGPGNAIAGCCQSGCRCHAYGRFRLSQTG